MDPDGWDVAGKAEMAEHWRTVVPDLTVDAAEDRSGIDNSRDRVSLTRQRYVLELKHLGGRKTSFVVSELTRLSDWSPLTLEQRLSAWPSSEFGLVRGVPSERVRESTLDPSDGLDFALLVAVAPALLPKGGLFLDGVPLVIASRYPLWPLAPRADGVTSASLR